MESDDGYFRARAAGERAAAEKAVSPEAHLELAFRYEEMASAIYRAGMPRNETGS